MACGQWRGSACSNVNLIVEDEEDPMTSNKIAQLKTQHSMPMNKKKLMSDCLLVTALCVCEALRASPPCGGPWHKERFMNCMEPFLY